MTWHRAISVAEAESMGCSKVEIEGTEILIIKLDGQFYAIDDLCSHADASLCDGEIEGEEIICPLHFARFNIKTGEVTAPPALEDIKTYKIEVKDSEIWVEV